MAQYATIADLRDAGLPPEALEGIDGREQVKFLVRAGDLIDTYLRSHHTLPIAGALKDPGTGLNTFPGELIRCSVIVAAYDLITWRGFASSGADEVWRERFEDCIKWLEQLAKGAVSIGDVDATPGTNEGAPKVVSNGSGTVNAAPDGQVRGW